MKGLDSGLVAVFCDKSVSEETRRAYRRAIREFFTFVGGIHPDRVTSDMVIAWRDDLSAKKKKSSTIVLKLSIVRSFFEYLRAAGVVGLNPASTRLVTPPKLAETSHGRALNRKEVNAILLGPDRRTSDGARDYAILSTLLRLGLRVSELCQLKASSICWSHGRWIVEFRSKGGRERTLPLPDDVRKAIERYLKLDAHRRAVAGSNGNDAYIFQPHSNYRTLIYDKALTPTMVWKIVTRWADYGGLGRLSPHDLRRTAITRALDQGLSYRQVQMMSGHKDPKTVMRYDQARENLDMNAVNFLSYDEDRT